MTSETPSIRKLAAIMFTDMVGYSALAQTHEDTALDLLDEHRGLLRPLFERYGGREVETIGDAFFVEFDSALEATRCAIAIQKLLHERNTGVDGAHKIVLRIGLHLGDVVHRGKHVHGDGVNIAARIEPCAEPGGIALSEDVARQVGNKLEMKIESLGHRQLKNILLPIEVFRVVLPWQQLTSTATRENHPAGPGSTIPVEVTSFIGRLREEDEVRQLIRRHPLVTLTGPAGTGKTRLSIQVAHSLKDEFRGGVFFVPLAAITDPELVPTAIAQSLNLRLPPGREPVDVIIEYVAGRHVLLILDNLEQVILAAPLITRLINSSPDLRIVVTSRIVLKVRGEQEYPVAPLRLPDLKHLPAYGALTQYGAVELFLQRAMSVKPDFAITNDNAPSVAEICYRLDGLPLAIELAAARVKLFSPQALLSRLGNSLDMLRSGLHDTPSRHQTLRQAIAWSYDLLPEQEKKLFRLMSVFVGGCSLDAVAALCIQEEELDPLEGIATLVDKSLLRKEEDAPGETRFWMLETIREFGLQALAGSGEEQSVRKAHALFFAGVCETVEPELTGPAQGLWLDRLEADNGNFRAAIHWGIKVNESTLAVRLCAALWRFWVTRGYMVEGMEKLKGVLGEVPHQRTRETARALNGLGTILHEMGNYGDAREVFHESLDIFRELREEKWIGVALNNLGWVSVHFGKMDEARKFSEEARDLHQRLNDRRGVAVAFNNLGWVAIFQGDYDLASTLHKQNLEMREVLGDKRGGAYAMINLAWTGIGKGHYEAAEGMLTKSQAILMALGDKQMLGFNLNIQAFLAFAQGRYDVAAVLIEQSIALMLEIGNKWGVSYELSLKGEIAFQRGDRELARKCFTDSMERFSVMKSRWGVATVHRCFGDLFAGEENWTVAVDSYKNSLGFRSDLGEQRGVCECLEGLAFVVLRQGNPGKATRLLATANSIRARIGAVHWFWERLRYDAMVAQMDARALASSQRETQSITLEAAAAEGMDP